MIDPQPIPTDESLALAAARDEAGAFAELLRRYQAPLLGFLRRFSMRNQDAEDLLQETVCRLFAARRQYCPRWHFRTWAFTIARRTAIDLHRRRARDAATITRLKNELPLKSSMQSASHLPGSTQDIWNVARQILTSEQVDALWLFHVEGIPPKEIARILDRSWVSVKTMLHRSRKQIRHALMELDSLQPSRSSGGTR